MRARFLGTRLRTLIALLLAFLATTTLLLTLFALLLQFDHGRRRFDTLHLLAFLLREAYGVLREKLVERGRFGLDELAEETGRLKVEVALGNLVKEALVGDAK